MHESLHAKYGHSQRETPFKKAPGKKHLRDKA